MDNPFKMLGSYIGLVFGVIIGYFSFSVIFALAEIGRFKTIHLLLPFAIILLGFLVGWALDSLIHRMHK